MRFVTSCLFAVLVCPATAAYSQTAADRYYDPDEMARAREALRKSHGAQINSLVLGERFEYLSGEGDPEFVWEAQGWIGNDINKLWLKTEGEYATEESGFEEFELQALYSRAVGPFWELQAGFRHDFNPDPTRSYFVVGVQGLAPYWFELDGALFLSDEGKLSARLEAEYELRITQRLIVQPRVALNGAFSDDAEIGIGSGLSTAQAGLRMRYEFRREFAPYLGVVWQRSFGGTRTLQRLSGEDSSDTSFVAGLRFWF